MTRRRRSYQPEVFRVGGVDGDRIMLVEDTWITGGTALSAAGALLAAGAESVVVTPIAREVNREFRTGQHRYLDYLSGAYDITHWPK